MSSKIFVGNLQYDVTERELRDRFAEIGAVERVEIPADPNSGRTRGFAFVEMATPQDAELAIERLAGVEMNGRPIRLEFAKSRGEHNREGKGSARPGARRWED
jgi:RNA recognition motif-containing protein